MDMLFGFFPSFWKDIAIFVPHPRITNAFCQVKVSELEPAFILLRFQRVPRCVQDVRGVL